jgi:hypothetical protein
MLAILFRMVPRVKGVIGSVLRSVESGSESPPREVEDPKGSRGRGARGDHYFLLTTTTSRQLCQKRL